jgi:hypothetical protein
MLMFSLEAFGALIVKQFMDYYRSWFDAKKAQANAWEVETRKGQMSSIVVSKASERAIKSVQVIRPLSAAAWNTGRTTEARQALRRVTANLTVVLLLGLVCILPACAIKPVVFYAQRFPMIELPDRPVLPEEPAEFTPREKLLVDYTATVEARVEKYNEIARDSNERNGYAGMD